MHSEVGNFHPGFGKSTAYRTSHMPLYWRAMIKRMEVIRSEMVFYRQSNFNRERYIRRILKEGKKLFCHRVMKRVMNGQYIGIHESRVGSTFF